MTIHPERFIILMVCWAATVQTQSDCLPNSPLCLAEPYLQLGTNGRGSLEAIEMTRIGRLSTTDCETYAFSSDRFGDFTCTDVGIRTVTLTANGDAFATTCSLRLLIDDVNGNLYRYYPLMFRIDGDETEEQEQEVTTRLMRGSPASQGSIPFARQDGRQAETPTGVDGIMLNWDAVNQEYVDLTNIAFKGGATSFSLEFYSKEKTANLDVSLFDFSQNSANRVSLGIDASGHLQFHWDNLNLGSRTYTSTIEIAEAFYTVCVVVTASGELTVYLGHTEIEMTLTQSSGSNGAVSTTFRQTATLGFGQSGKYFRGVLQRFRLYDSALTARDVRRISLRQTVPEANCVSGAIVKTLSTSNPGTVSITAVEANSASTQCGGGFVSTFAISRTSFACADVLQDQTVILTVTDDFGREATCEATVDVVDSTAPVPVCQAREVLLTKTFPTGETFSTAVSPNSLVTSVTENCPRSNYNIKFYKDGSQITGIGCENAPVVVSIAVFDEASNSGHCTSEVTVTDTVDPTPQCVATIVAANVGADGIFLPSPSELDAGSVDNCGIKSRTLSPSSFDCADTRTHNVQLTVEDFAGNIKSCNGVFRVEDTGNPIARCTDTTLALAGSGPLVGTATLTQQLLGADASEDVCEIRSITFAPPTFGCNNRGANAVTVTVTDNSFNTDVTVCTVTITDETAPEAVCRATYNVAIEGVNQQTTLAASEINDGSSDNCQEVSDLSLSQSVFDCSAKGTEVTVTMVAKDPSGNSDTCTTVISVSDGSEPVVNCNDFVVKVGDGATSTTLSAADVAESSTDNCDPSNVGVITEVLDLAGAYACADISVQTGTFTATDASGNKATCTSQITIEDGFPPTLTCAAVTTFDVGNANANLPASAQATASDSCSAVTSQTSLKNTFTCGDVALSQQTTTVTATDSNGNSQECAFHFHVQDSTVPTVSCESGKIVALDATGSGTLEPSDVITTSFDRCAVKDSSISRTSYSCSDVTSTLTVNAFVTDFGTVDSAGTSDGNVASCSSSIDVQDNIAPTIECITTAFNVVYNTETLVFNDIVVAAADGCGLSSTSVSQSQFSCADLGATTVTATATDVNSNVKTCTAIINVLDVEDPTPGCIGIRITKNVGAGENSITPSDINSVRTTDECGLVRQTVLQLNSNSGQLEEVTEFTCGDRGSQTVTLEVEDTASNTATCTALVTVEDTIKPSVACKTGVTVTFGDASGVTIDPDDIIDSSGTTEECGIRDSKIDLSTWDCLQAGIRTVTVWVTDWDELVHNGDFVSTTDKSQKFLTQTLQQRPIFDSTGLTDTCSAEVVILDTTPPSLTCDPSTTVQVGTGAVVDISTTIFSDLKDDPNFLLSKHDACGLSGSSFAGGPATVSCGDVGSVAITLQVEDRSANPTTCEIQVVVKDTEPPSLTTCKSDTTLDVGSGPITLSTTDVMVATDTCDPNPSLSINNNVFGCNSISGGVSTMTATATDISGNAATCHTTITVEDDTPPALTCTTTIVTAELTGSSVELTTDMFATATDGCGDPTLQLVPTSFGCGDAGSRRTVTVTASDSVNTATCEVEVDVVDAAAPILTCHGGSSTLTIDVGDGSVVGIGSAGVLTDSTGTTVSFVSDTTDNCDAGSLTSSYFPRNSVSCADISIAVYTLTASDDAGNTDTCTVSLNIADLVPPTVTCITSTFTVELVDAGSEYSAELTGGDLISPGSANDECSDNVSVTPSPTQVKCEKRQQTHEVLVRAGDSAGNTETCAVQVFVADVDPPVLACSSTLTVQLGDTCYSAVTLGDIVTSLTDNCAITDTLIDITAFNYTDLNVETPVGVTVVDYGTVADVTGNNATCIVTVLPVDTTPPTISCVGGGTVEVGHGVDTVWDFLSRPSTVYDIATSDFVLCDDNCGLSIDNFAVNPSTLNCGELPVATVTFTAEDDSGNSATTSCVVTVADTVPPEFECTNVAVTLAGVNNEASTIVANLTVDGCSDECTECFLRVPDSSQLAWDCTHRGEVIDIQITGEDNFSNMETCIAKVTVVDPVPPTITCNTRVDVTLNQWGEPDWVGTKKWRDILSFYLHAHTDNCGITDAIVDYPTATCGDTGTGLTATVYVTDSGHFVGIPQNDTYSWAPDATIHGEDAYEKFWDTREPGFDSVKWARGASGKMGFFFPYTDEGGGGLNHPWWNKVEERAKYYISESPPPSPPSAPSPVPPVTTLDPNEHGTPVSTDTTDTTDTSQTVSHNPFRASSTDDPAGIFHSLLTDQGVRLNVGQVSRTPGPAGYEYDLFEWQGGSYTDSAYINPSDIKRYDGTGGATDSPYYYEYADDDSYDHPLYYFPGTWGKVEDVLWDETGEYFDRDIVDRVNQADLVSCLKDELSIPDTLAQSVLDAFTFEGEDEAISMAYCMYELLGYGMDSWPYGHDGMGQTWRWKPEYDDSNNKRRSTNGGALVYPDALWGMIYHASNLVGDLGDNEDEQMYNYLVEQLSFYNDDGEVRDPLGNIVSCYVEVQVRDYLPPTLECSAATVYNGNGGTIEFDSLTETLAPISSTSDNCADNVTLSFWPSDDLNCTVAEEGSQTITVVASDDAGNTASCFARIVVKDEIPPAVTCQEVTFSIGTDAWDADHFVSSAEDNCTDVTTSTTTPQFDCTQICTSATITITATDEGSNTDTCETLTFIEDTTAPVIDCQAITVEVGVEDATFTRADIDQQIVINSPDDFIRSVTDDCATVKLANILILPSVFSCGDVGSHSVEATAGECAPMQDTGTPGSPVYSVASGKYGICTALVVVEDTTPPVLATCDTGYVISLDGVGTATLNPADALQATDHCTGVPTYGADQTEFSCSDVGAHPVLLTADDTYNNTLECDAHGFTVADDIGPTVTCPMEVLVFEIGAEKSITLTPADVFEATDNCGIASTGLSRSVFDCIDVFHLRAIDATATDVNGNSASCKVLLGFNDTSKPDLVCDGPVTLELNAVGSEEIAPRVRNDAGDILQITTTNDDQCVVTESGLDRSVFSCGDRGATQTTTLYSTDQGSIDTFPPAQFFYPDNRTEWYNEAIVWADGITGNEPTDGTANPFVDTPEPLGNIASCTLAVIVEDNTEPAITCTSTVVDVGSGSPISVTAGDICVYSDNCNVASVSLSVSEFDCNSLNSNSIWNPVLTVVDDAVTPNSDFRVATVFLKDLVAPDPGCETSILTVDVGATGATTAPDTDTLAPDASDACNSFSIGPVLSVTPTQYTCDDAWTTKVVLMEAVDSKQNRATCESNVYVRDQVKPSLSCVGSYGATLGYEDRTLDLTDIGKIATTITDMCGISDKHLSTSVFSCGDRAANIVSTLSVVDHNTVLSGDGNTATCAVSINVIDDSKPVMNCNDFSINVGPNPGSTRLNFADMASATDNCAVSSTTVLTQSVFTCGDLTSPIRTATLQATDDNPGTPNVETCAATLTVYDDVEPAAICRNVAITLESHVPRIITNADVNDGSHDVCGLSSMSLEQSNYGCEDRGVKTIVLTVADTSLNEDVCSSQITVVDDKPPTTNCLGNSAVTLDTEGRLQLSNADIGSAEDLCGVNIELSPAGVDCNNVGNPSISVITLWADDGQKPLNLVSCTTEVTVVDNTKPSMTCTDTTIRLNRQGEAEAEADDFRALTSDFKDACGLSTSAKSLSPSFFTCGDAGRSHDVEVLITDTHGNTATCSSQILVLDDEKPDLDCPTSARIELSTSLAQEFSSLMPGTSKFDGTLTLTAGDKIEAFNNMIAGSIGAFTQISVADNCKEDITALFTQDQFGCAQVGNTLSVGVTATDDHSNKALCTIQVKVDDKEAPVARCRRNLVITLPPTGQKNIIDGEPTYDREISADDVDNGSSDNCENIIFTKHLRTTDGKAISRVTCADTSDDVLLNLVVKTNPAGFIDAQSAECEARVEVRDNSGPIITCDGTHQFAVDENGSVGVTARNLINTEEDNCGTAGLIRNITRRVFSCDDVNPDPTANPLLIRVTATDSAGHSATCNAAVKIVDETPPVVGCVGTYTITLDTSGQRSIAAAEIDDGSTDDNCGVVELFFSHQLPANAGLTVNYGSTVTFGCDQANTDFKTTLCGVDKSGQVGCCNRRTNVHIVGVEAPTVVCAAGSDLELDSSGQLQVRAGTQPIGTASRTDVCDVEYGYVFPVDRLYTCANIGDSFEIDLNAITGNQAETTCKTTVTIRDKKKPIAVCSSAFQVDLDAAGTARVVQGRLDAGSSDNCESITKTVQVHEGQISNTVTCADKDKALLVSLLLEDGSGNTDSCSTRVTVLDSSAPTLSCPLNGVRTVTLDAGGNGVFTAADARGDFLNAVDNCDEPSALTVSTSLTSFSCPDTEFDSFSVTWTVQDTSSNSATCEQNVVVIDEVKPGLTCVNPPSRLDAGATGQLVLTRNSWAMFSNFADACGISNTVTFVPPAFECGAVGQPATRVVVNVKDRSGNTETCEVDVAITDDTPPVAICNDEVVPLNLKTDGTVKLFKNKVDGNNAQKSFDLCGPVTTRLSKSDFTCDDIGRQAVFLTVIDGNGNSASCSATIDVMDVVENNGDCVGIDEIVLRDETIDGVRGVTPLTPESVQAGEQFSACTATQIPLDVELTTGARSVSCQAKGQSVSVRVFVDGDAFCVAEDLPVVDRTAPQLTCPASHTVSIPAGGSSLSLASVDIATYLDNCDGSLDVAQRNRRTQPQNVQCNQVGTTVPVVVFESDTSGNEGSCDVQVVVQDTVPPSITCPSLTQVFTVGFQNNGVPSLAPALLGITNIQDNCLASLATPWTYRLASDGSTLTWGCATAGINRVIRATITDKGGNKNFCDVTTTYSGGTSELVASCAADETLVVNLGAAKMGILAPSAVYQGNPNGCGGNPTLTLSEDTFECKDIGKKTVTLFVTASGQTKSCTSVIVVADTQGQCSQIEPPVVECDAEANPVTVAGFTADGDENIASRGQARFVLDDDPATYFAGQIPRNTPDARPRLRVKFSVSDEAVCGFTFRLRREDHTNREFRLRFYYASNTVVNGAEADGFIFLLQRSYTVAEPDVIEFTVTKPFKGHTLRIDYAPKATQIDINVERTLTMSISTVRVNLVPRLFPVESPRCSSSQMKYPNSVDTDVRSSPASSVIDGNEDTFLTAASNGKWVSAVLSHTDALPVCSVVVQIGQGLGGFIDTLVLAVRFNNGNDRDTGFHTIASRSVRKEIGSFNVEFDTPWTGREFRVWASGRLQVAELMVKVGTGDETGQLEGCVASTIPPSTIFYSPTAATEVNVNGNPRVTVDGDTANTAAATFSIARISGASPIVWWSKLSNGDITVCSVTIMVPRRDRVVDVDFEVWTYSGNNPTAGVGYDYRRTVRKAKEEISTRQETTFTFELGVSASGLMIRSRQGRLDLIEVSVTKLKDSIGLAADQQQCENAINGPVALGPWRYTYEGFRHNRAPSTAFNKQKAYKGPRPGTNRDEEGDEQAVTVWFAESDQLVCGTRDDAGLWQVNVQLAGPRDAKNEPETRYVISLYQAATDRWTEVSDETFAPAATFREASKTISLEPFYGSAIRIAAVGSRVAIKYVPINVYSNIQPVPCDETKKGTFENALVVSGDTAADSPSNILTDGAFSTRGSVFYRLVETGTADVCTISIRFAAEMAKTTVLLTVYDDTSDFPAVSNTDDFSVVAGVRSTTVVGAISVDTTKEDGTTAAVQRGFKVNSRISAFRIDSIKKLFIESITIKTNKPVSGGGSKTIKLSSGSTPNKLYGTHRMKTHVLEGQFELTAEDFEEEEEDTESTTTTEQTQETIDKLNKSSSRKLLSVDSEESHNQQQATTASTSITETWSSAAIAMVAVVLVLGIIVTMFRSKGNDFRDSNSSVSLTTEDKPFSAEGAGMAADISSEDEEDEDITGAS